MTDPDWKSSKFAIESILSGQPTNQQFHYPIRNGSMRVGLYAPKNIDDQSHHTQDEIYIVVNGSGWFNRGDERVPFKPQDVLFISAGTIHSFEDFTADFATWVIFWGPDGGEIGRCNRTAKGA
jgi:mannose-6-phosphate isomerase-like protein (cupin superfamily)